MPINPKRTRFQLGCPCPPKPIYKNIYNPENITKFPWYWRQSDNIINSVPRHLQCLHYANQTLNQYGKWAGCPGGSGAGFSSRMRYTPSLDTSGLGPRVGGPPTIDRNG